MTNAHTALLWSPDRAPHASNRPAIVAGIFIGACLLPVTAASAVPAAQTAPVAQTAETSARELQEAQELLARATAEFEGTQQNRSIVLFDQIIDKLEGLNRQAALPPRGRELLLTAYELRGRAYFNIGLQEKASDNFRAVIQLQPQYTLSKEKISPKIVEHFNSVKKALVAYLAVTSKPAGARVTLSGTGEPKDLGLTDFFPVEVLAGDYTLEVSREGYRGETRTLSLAPKATEIVSVELVRTLASAFMITEPAGVEIWVDGELRATTAGTLAGEPGAGELARGVDPAKASARLEIPRLTPGSHAVEFRRKCFETVRRTIEVPEPRDYDVPPVRLEDSVGSLRLTSDPPGAKIFLDGEAMGQTPKELEGICSGKHRLEVKHTAGKFVQDFVLQRNEGLVLDCPIRPSLAFLGVVAQSTAGERVLAEAAERLVQNLQKMATLNFVPAPRESVDRLLEAESLTLKSLLPGAGADADVVRRLGEKLAASFEVQGFLLASLPDERLQRTANLHLYASGNAVADSLDVNWTESASFLRFFDRIDQKVAQYRPWTGLVTVDTRLHEGVPVLRVVPGSPAAQAGIEPGDIVISADGKPVKVTQDVLGLVEKEKKPKDRLALHVRGAAGTRAIDVVVGETPQEILLNDPALLYNKVMMDLRQQVEGYPGTDGAAFARLNWAIAAMHFGDFAAAHEHLLKAKNELPQRAGLSQGTALYYLGLSLERLGYKKEASDAYRAAGAAKDATLFNNDGPAVAPMATRRGTP